MHKPSYNRILLIVITLFCLIPMSAFCHANSSSRNKQNFIRLMEYKYHFKKSYITQLINHIQFNPEVIERIEAPYEDKPWYIYEGLFLTNERARAGALYWLNHNDAFSKVENKYGVPSGIIAAIVGVESFYGHAQGNFSALNALATLAFGYPSRAKFFKNELAEYLVLTKELHIDPASIKGSYAGAIGYPQFMPSSYLYYATTLNKNHVPDLFHDDSDVIASVANFLKKAGWERGQPIALQVHVIGNKYKRLLNSELTTKYSITTLKKHGIIIKQRLPANIKANIIQLRTAHGYSYWLGFHNFYVITHYNTSIEYAMAVTLLAAKISDCYQND